jgi:hypothetical protein
MAKKQIKLRSEHFYMEDGLMVFTEVYHLEKGYCCNNACRHCPYPKSATTSPKKSSDKVPKK